MWNNYFNVYLYHTYKWQRILNHCDIDGISYCRILLLTNTRTFANATTFSVENRLLGNEKSGRGFALSDADTLPQSNQASFSLIFAPFSDTSFQSARLNFSHWNNTEKNCTFSLFETGSGGIEKSHSCKWAKWIQWHALPHIQQSTQQWNKGYYPNLHGWDFSIPPSPWNQCQWQRDVCIHYDVSLSQRNTKWISTSANYYWAIIFKHMARPVGHRSWIAPSIRWSCYTISQKSQYN